MMEGSDADVFGWSDPVLLVWVIDWFVLPLSVPCYAALPVVFGETSCLEGLEGRVL